MTTNIATLGDLRTAGYRVRAWCTACLHDAEMDLDALIGRLGADRAFSPPTRLGLVCGGCGRRDVRLTLLARHETQKPAASP